MLKSNEESRPLLHCQLANQEQLTDSTKNKAEKLEKAEAGIISKACRKGFQRCKYVTEAHLLIPGVDPPRADLSNEGLKSKVNNHVRIFTKGLNLLYPAF